MSFKERAIKFVQKNRKVATSVLLASMLLGSEVITPVSASNSNDNNDPNSEASNMGNTKKRLEKENKQERGKESKEKKAQEEERKSKSEQDKPGEKPRNPIDAAIDACIAEKTKLYAGTDYAAGRLNVGFKPEVTLYRATEIVWKERLKYSRPSLYPGLNILVVSGIEKGKGKEISQACRFEIIYPNEVRFAEPDRIVRAAPSSPR